MSNGWLALLILAFSFLLTLASRHYALSKSLLDVPGQRSSHVVPTPRGGGLAIVISFLLACAVLAVQSIIAAPMALALLGAGALVAVIGFLDDHGHVPVRWRLLAHFGAAIWVVFWLQGLPPLSLFGFAVEPGWVGYPLAVVGLVWLLNLYNFMDGIDGIASVEAICASLGGCLLYAWSGREELILPLLLLGAAVGGFLILNFPPARIFMGDVGSGFLGIVLGVFALQGAWQDPTLFWVWLILLGVFIVDATFTLLRRLARGENVHEAHRSHAYQFASRRHRRHLPVTLAVVLINLGWLLPIAFCVQALYLDGAVGLLLAYAPLLAIAVKYKAGERE